MTQKSTCHNSTLILSYFDPDFVIVDPENVIVDPDFVIVDPDFVIFRSVDPSFYASYRGAKSIKSIKSTKHTYKQKHTRLVGLFVFIKKHQKPND